MGFLHTIYEALCHPNVRVFFVFFLVGFLPFSFVNGMYSEIAVWKRSTVECDKIGTFVSSVYNVANIFPFIYLGLISVRPIPEVYTVTIITLIGIVGCFVVGGWWDSVSEFAGHHFSSVILSGSLMSGLVGCVLVVVVFGFTGSYTPLATSAASAGMGGSGIVIGILTIIQTHTDFEGSDYAFTVMDLFICVVVMMICGLIAFYSVIYFHIGEKSVLSEKLLASLDGSGSGADFAILRIEEESRLGGGGGGGNPQNTKGSRHTGASERVSVADGIKQARHSSSQRSSGSILSRISGSLLGRRTGGGASVEDEEEARKGAGASAAVDQQQQYRETELLEVSMHSFDGDGSSLETSRPMGGNTHLLFENAADNNNNNNNNQNNNNNNNNNNQYAIGENESADWKTMFKLAGAPCLINLASSASLYFVNPGLFPFLTASGRVISVMNSVLQAANMLGRLSSAFIPFSYTLPLTIFQIAISAFLIVVGAVSSFSAEWLVIIAVGIVSLLNGFIATRVYLDVDENARRLRLPTSEAKRGRRLTSLCNQMGSVAGAYLCLAASVTNFFVNKQSASPTFSPSGC